MADEEDPTAMDVYRIDLQSQARIGLKSNALGFPLSGLVYGNIQDAEAFADRVLARHSSTINRVTSIEVDTRTDPRWLPILADLDIGDGLLVKRSGLPADDEAPLEYRCVVTGVVHELSSESGWRATIYTTTTERTL